MSDTKAPITSENPVTPTTPMWPISLSPDAAKVLRYLAGCHGGVEAAQVARDTHVNWLVVARELSHLELAGLCHRNHVLFFYGPANGGAK